MTRRDGLLVSFLFATGLRISEALGIRLTDLTEDSDWTDIRVLGKGKKLRTVRTETRLIAAIRDAFPGETWLFSTVNGGPMLRRYAGNQIRKGALRILGRQLSPHSLRHSFATAAYQESGDINAVSKELGHSSVSITSAVYLHTGLTDDVRKSVVVL